MIRRFSMLLLLLALQPAYAQVQEPTHMMVLVDVTGSPGAERRDAARLRAAQEWLKLIPAGRLTVAVYQYDQTPRVVAPFIPLASEQQRQELIEKTKAIQITGEKADLKGALTLALTELSKAAAAEQGTGVLVLLTEGRVSAAGGIEKLELNAQTIADLRSDLLPRFVQQEVRIFTLAFTDNANSVLLREISRETKGSFHFGFQPRALQELYMGIFNQVLRPQSASSRTKMVELTTVSTQALFILERESDKDEMTITAPGGAASYSSREPDKQQNAKWQISPDSLLLCITQPPAGMWTITNSLSPANRVSVLVDPVLVIDAPQTLINETEPLAVSAWFETNGERVANKIFLDSLQWEARLFSSPDDEGKLLGLLDASGEAQDLGSDGLRSGSFHGDFGEGARRLLVTVRGDAFQAQGATQVEFTADRLHVTLDRIEGASGEALPIWVRCEPPGGVAAQITVKAIILHPDGDSSTATIEDFAPYQYSEALSGFDQVGGYIITVLAQGEAANGELFAYSSPLFHYQVRESGAIPSIDDPQTGKFTPRSDGSGAIAETPAASGWLNLLIGLQGMIVIATGAFFVVLWNSGRQHAPGGDLRRREKSALAPQSFAARSSGSERFAQETEWERSREQSAAEEAGGDGLAADDTVNDVEEGESPHREDDA